MLRPAALFPEWVASAAPTAPRPGSPGAAAGAASSTSTRPGSRVDDEETLERIRQLAIPPAWTDVWICLDPPGHLQAVGTDAAGRRQYRYHERWRAAPRPAEVRRDGRVREGAAAAARRRRRALAVEGLPRERVLACAVRLLDRGFFRVGGEEYAGRQRQLRARHAREAPRHARRRRLLVFDYVAKSGKRRLQAVVDPEVYEVVAELKARRGRGRELLAYRTRGRWADVRSNDINDFVKELTGAGFSAKDFRTWHATVLAAVALAVSEAATSKTGRKRAVTRAIAEVAHYLGNTPAVCRASYIDPRVFDRYRRAGVTIAPAIEGSRSGTTTSAGDAGRRSRRRCSRCSNDRGSRRSSLPRTPNRRERRLPRPQPPARSGAARRRSRSRSWRRRDVRVGTRIDRAGPASSTGRDG